MGKARILEFDSNDCLIGCSTGWSVDSQGYEGVWCSCENGKKYFIRKGESVLSSRLRHDKKYHEGLQEVKVDTNDNYVVESLVFALYSSIRRQLKKRESIYKTLWTYDYVYYVEIFKIGKGFSIKKKWRNE